MQVRTATHLDVETMCDIFFASYNDLHRRHGLAEENPEDRDWLADAIRHVLRTDPSGTVLATDDGTPTAFATSYLRDSYWFLSFLFVSPDAQGRGVGKALLDAVMPPESDGLTRALVVESFQPVSAGLYAGHGITPRGVRYVLTGLTDPARLPESGAGIEVADVTTDAIAEMSELDRRQLGFARPADHEWWLRSEMTAHAYRRDGELVGYAYVDEEGVVGPALGEDDATACAIVADLLRRAEHPETLKVPVYGSNALLFRMLVRAGARIEPSDFRYFYCSSDGALPSTYIHYAGYMA
jgi:GNAT superfamily N-acetyltransferase